MPLRIFPVFGGANYSNDWGDPRSGGRVHLGNDLFAREGTPLLAVDDGNVRFGTDPLGGNIANLRASDGTRYYYAHLSNFYGTSGRNVHAGDVIGYLGKTGNAVMTPPHVHFEMHPGGGEAMNPFPFLQSAEVRRSAGPVARAGLFWPVAIAVGVGLAAWAWTEPTTARRLWRRVAA